MSNFFFYILDLHLPTIKVKGTVEGLLDLFLPTDIIYREVFNALIWLLIIFKKYLVCLLALHVIICKPHAVQVTAKISQPACLTSILV